MSTWVVGKNENMFLIVGFCAKQILGIIRSQIDIERIFFKTRILTSFKRCYLHLECLDKLIFVKKNWPNDLRIRCKSHSSLIDIIEIDVNLDEELEEFEGAFEMDQVMEF